MIWRKGLKRAATGALLALAAHGAMAEEKSPKQLQQGMNELAHEYARCAAYFLVVSIALENSAKPDVAVKYKTASDQALAYSAKMAETAGLMGETAQARFEIEFVEMTKRMEGNTSNLSILSKDFATPCEEAMENPGARIKHLLQ